MRNKLALTVALTVLAAVLGGGLANGASLPNVGTSVTLPGTTTPLQICPPSTPLNLPHPNCIVVNPPPVTTPTSPSPPTTTTSPGTTTSTSPGSSGNGSGNTSVSVTPSGKGGKNGGANGQTGGVGPGKGKHQGKNQQMNNVKPPPQYQSNGTPTVSNPSTTIGSFGPAPIGVPNFVISQFDIPPFLLPIYQACGSEYDIPWEVLAGINKVETAFGTNLNVSSAGAEGWMQFEPSTWAAYGVDANGDGRKDPYNPVDAICAAARYLRAAGGNHNISSAVFSYNHASWYVDEVMLAARSYGAIPGSLLGSLTGLTQDDHFPIAANSRYADDLSARLALHDSTTAAKQYGNAARVIESSPTRRGINIYSHQGAPVVAVNDSVVKKIGTNRKLGHYIVLKDSYGNIFTYAQLGSIARTYPVPKPVKPTAADLTFAPRANGKKPTAPATSGVGNLRHSLGGHHGNLGKSLGTVLSKLVQGAPAKKDGNSLGSVFSKLAQGAPARNSGRGSLGGQLNNLAGQKVPGYSTFKGYFANVFGLNRKDAALVPLHTGSHVDGGTVLARVGGSQSGIAPHINFSIKPVGAGAGQIDPKPILDGWQLQQSTAIYRAAGKNPFASRMDVGGVLLLPKDDLERRVLGDPRLQIYPCGRNDIRTGQIDRRVLATMEFLVAKGFRLTISSLKCGQNPLSKSSEVSQDTSGDGMDISAINSIPVAGNTGKGTLSDAVMNTALQMQGAMRPDPVDFRKDRVGSVNSRRSRKVSVVHVGFSSPLGPGSYVNPFKDATVTEGRIDQGVDFTGTGPIDAIGDAQILGVGAPGWPQGGGVLYRLLDGSRAGAVIYVFEGVAATVKPGQRVTAGQQIAKFTPGSIEMGFADASGTPLSHAIYHEGLVTPWGQRMAAFLASIEGNTSGGQFTQLLSPGQQPLALTK